jgi:hypothetical protein
MAYSQRGGVDKTDCRRLSPPEKLGIDEQREEGVPGQFHEPVVTDRSGKIGAKLRADATLIVPFEAAVAADVE